MYDCYAVTQHIAGVSEFSNECMYDTKTQNHNRIRFAVGVSDPNSNGILVLLLGLFRPLSLTANSSLSLKIQESSLNRARLLGLGRGLA